MAIKTSPTLDLFTAYPMLATHLPYLPLATLPTPVQQASTFASCHNIGSLHIKRDDQSAALYGGNKTRKLGFLLGAAQAAGAKSVLTFGAAGSNHALATALYARECGMKAALVLGPQHNSPHVRENIQAMVQAEAILCPCSWEDSAATAAARFHKLWKQDGTPPYVIPPGGSSPSGTLGFVNAAYELRQQIDDGILPEPDLLYAASGTMGTCIGLALGLRALGMKTKVMAIRVTTEPYTGMERANTLFTVVNALLHRADAKFPAAGLQQQYFDIRDEFFGQDYALYTPEGIAAIQIAEEELSLSLEGTYTGKTFAGLVADASSGLLRDKNVLFWNTYNGKMAETTAAQFSYEKLPAMLRTFFETTILP